MKRFHEEKNKMRKRRRLARINNYFKGVKKRLGYWRKKRPLGCPNGKKCGVCHDGSVKHEPTKQEIEAELKKEEGISEIEQSEQEPDDQCPICNRIIDPEEMLWHIHCEHFMEL